jgi:hypothetical protein
MQKFKLLISFLILSIVGCKNTTPNTSLLSQEQEEEARVHVRNTLSSYSNPSFCSTNEPCFLFNDHFEWAYFTKERKGVYFNALDDLIIPFSLIYPKRSYEALSVKVEEGFKDCRLSVSLQEGTSYLRKSLLFLNSVVSIKGKNFKNVSEKIATTERPCLQAETIAKTPSLFLKEFSGSILRSFLTHEKSYHSYFIHEKEMYQSGIKLLETEVQREQAEFRPLMEAIILLYAKGELYLSKLLLTQEKIKESPTSDKKDAKLKELYILYLDSLIEPIKKDMNALQDLKDQYGPML